MPVEARIIIIGSGSAIIREDRHAPSFLLEAGDRKLLFDCGWGVGENLQKAGIALKELDHILITHPHADHQGGLINLIHSLHVNGVYHGENIRTKPLYLHGYPGLAENFEALRKMMFLERVESFPIVVKEYTDSKEMVDGVEIRSRLVPHVPEYFQSVSFRVGVDGKSLVYSGDCGYNQALVDLAQASDVAVLESCIPPSIYQQTGPRPNHMSPYENGLIAQQAGIRTLILTHLYDNFTKQEAEEEIRKNFSGNFIFPHDLQVIEI